VAFDRLDLIVPKPSEVSAQSNEIAPARLAQRDEAWLAARARNIYAIL
jgi:hypothetical protein